MEKSLYRSIDEKEFIDILTNKLKLERGDVVFVHSSIDRMNISLSPYRILSLLIEAVGEEGTLLFPGWHFSERAEDYIQKGKVFDVRKSPSAMGLISELARRHPEAKRSLHPTNSIIAIGKEADYLIKDHGTSIYPCDETSPFYKMLEFNAKIIGLGVTTEFLSFVHCPEDVLKEKFPYPTRSQEVFSTTVVDWKGKVHETKTLVANKAIAQRNIPKFIRKHIPTSTVKQFTLRKNRFFLAEADLLYKELIRLANQGITIYSV
jgi:aminoglycoside 3-N-acetyltransferase